MQHETATRIGAAFIVITVAAAVFAVIQLGRPQGSGWVVLDRYNLVIENRETSDVEIQMRDVLDRYHGFRIPAGSWVSLPDNVQWSDIQRVDGTCRSVGISGVRWGRQVTRVVTLDYGQENQYEGAQPSIPATIPAVESSPCPNGPHR